MLQFKVTSSKARIDGIVFLDKNKNMLPINYSNLISTTATDRTTETNINDLLKGTGSPPYGGNTPMTYVIDISDFQEIVSYIRIIAPTASGYDNAEIKLYYSYNSLIFEAVPNSENIVMGASTYTSKDIDVKELQIVGNKMIIKNPITNQHYSLAEKTLIPLPDSSPKNMILHGIEAGKEIRLDEAFNKIQYPIDVSGLGQDLKDRIVVKDVKGKIKKITLK